MTEPAFPVETTSTPYAPGLTKREYAAIHIAAGIASRRTVHDDEAGVAVISVALADAVLRRAGE